MIIVRDLVVQYGTTTALDGVSANFSPGSITALVGHNGSGKSTLLQVLTRTVAPTSGEVVGLDNLTVAYVPQRSAARDDLPLTVREVVAMGAWQRRGLWRRLTKSDCSGIDTALERLGITALTDRRIGDLSGGQRQRALIAQALVQRGDLLLLDEPATGLDEDARTVILDVMRTEADRGATVVVATHDRVEAEGADHTLRLTQGAVEVVDHRR
ncbi:MAG: metal ABC transporter ATP-binding protein [Rhodococcus sp.]|nr:metal ABC transporter ATP-binding protein [Rhodococcus sp. (in: high G+C Gram-positive bacteria)]